MASNLLPFAPSTIRAASSDHLNKFEPKRRPNSSLLSNGWTSLFDWSSEHDYIPDGPVPLGEPDLSSTKKVQGRSVRFVPGCFAEEKARRLRMMISVASAFHETMYHSSIASRLASDFGNGNANEDE